MSFDPLNSNNSQWFAFIKENSHRGYGLNRASKLAKNNAKVFYSKSDKSLKITSFSLNSLDPVIFDLSKALNSGRHSFTISRFIHDIRMRFSKNYQKKCEERYKKLAEMLTHKKIPESEKENNKPIQNSANGEEKHSNIKNLVKHSGNENQNPSPSNEEGDNFEGNPIQSSDSLVNQLNNQQNIDNNEESNKKDKQPKTFETFDFNESVDVSECKKSLKFIGYKNEDFATTDLLKKHFKKEVIDRIATSQSLSMRFEQYGFKSLQAYQKFLEDPLVKAELRPKLTPPNKRISPDLYLKLKEIEREYNEDQSYPDIKVLNSLYPIFNLLKGLNKEEIETFTGYSQTSYDKMILNGYLKGYSLEEFCRDLNIMEPFNFEEKYSGCYNGMFQNIVSKILESERLYEYFKL